jgi:hypothetical protein
MRTRRALLIVAVLFCFVAARHRAALPPAREPVADVFSASNPRSVEATHTPTRRISPIATEGYVVLRDTRRLPQRKSTHE